MKLTPLVKWQRTAGKWESSDDYVGRIKRGAAEIRLSGAFLLKVSFVRRNRWNRMVPNIDEARVQFAASGPAILTESQVAHLPGLIEQAKEKLKSRRLGP
jgi:hypothetical protein